LDKNLSPAVNRRPQINMKGKLCTYGLKTNQLTEN